VKTDLFPGEFILELNTKNMGNSLSFPTNAHTTMSTKRFRSYGISTIDVTAEFCSGQNIGGTDLQFSVSDWLNSGCPEYHFGRQHSQISDGPSNGSKRLAICELRQSETRPVTESAFLADHTFLYKIGFW
jgi:hypothetical protein